MTKVPSKYATPALKAYLAESILKAAAMAPQSTSEVLLATTAVLVAIAAAPQYFAMARYAALSIIGILSSTLAKTLNGLALDRGAKHGVDHFFYGHGQAETARKIAVVSACPANALSPALSQIGQSRAEEKGRSTAFLAFDSDRTAMSFSNTLHGC